MPQLENVRGLPAEIAPCQCVKVHRPKQSMTHIHHIHPRNKGGSDDPSNLVWLCPNAHYNVHDLIRDWERAGGIQPRNHANRYLYDLARAGYEAEDLTP